MANRTVAALITALLVGACQTHPTAYGPDHSGAGGYTQEQLAPDRYVVGFRGNAETSFERVRQSMVYRAAELTLEQGYSHFRLVSGAVADDVKTIAVDELLERRQSLTYAHNIYGYIASYEPFAPPNGVSRADRFDVSAEIEMTVGDPGSRLPYLDALEVLDALGPVVRERGVAP